MKVAWTWLYLHRPGHGKGVVDREAWHVDPACRDAPARASSRQQTKPLKLHWFRLFSVVCTMLCHMSLHTGDSSPVYRPTATMLTYIHASCRHACIHACLHVWIHTYMHRARQASRLTYTRRHTLLKEYTCVVYTYIFI